jgi:hypothetical protein
VDPFLLILRPCLRRKREIWTEAGYFLKTFIAFPSQQEVARTCGRAPPTHTREARDRDRGEKSKEPILCQKANERGGKSIACAGDAEKKMRLP